jgi:hypothetical protein
MQACFSFLLAEILKEASDTTIRIIEHYGQLIIRAYTACIKDIPGTATIFTVSHSGDIISV